MACKIILNNKEYTEEQFKKLLASNLLYETLNRNLVSLPETSINDIEQPKKSSQNLRANFVYNKKDLIYSLQKTFGYSVKEATVSAELSDRMAGAWSKLNNRPKEDYYSTLTLAKVNNHLTNISEDPTQQLLFKGLNDFKFIDDMQFEDDDNRSSYTVYRDKAEVGQVEIQKNENGEFYVSWFSRIGGQQGDGARILKSTMQNLLNRGFKVGIDDNITSAGFAAMKRLANEGFLKQVGEEITEPNQRSLKPMFYEKVPFEVLAKANQDNLLFQIVGEKGVSNNDDISEMNINLALAKKMESKNKSSKEIYSATGWERGKDNKWRYELPYLEIKQNRLSNLLLSANESNKLEYFIDAKELFKLYPEIKKYTIETGFFKEKFKGAFNQDTKTILLSTEFLNTPEELKKTLIHEIQHAIQNIEGFETGTNSRVTEDYRKAAGEVEARNASNRGVFNNYSPKELGLPISETEDVAREEQILLSNFKENRKKAFEVLAKANQDNLLFQSANNFQSNEIEKVAKGFNLVPTQGFGLASFKTKNGVASKALVKQLQQWTSKNGLDNYVTWAYESTYGTITAIPKNNNLLYQNSISNIRAFEKYDLNKLKRLGSGSDRLVFDLGNGKVLKVAWNERGLSQNMFESDYKLINSKSIPNIYEIGKDYVIVDKLEPNTEKINNFTNELRNLLIDNKSFSPKNSKNILNNIELLTPIFNKYKVSTDIINSGENIIWGDLANPENWGEDKNNNILLLDGGTLSDNKLLKENRNPIYKYDNRNKLNIINEKILDLKGQRYEIVEKRKKLEESINPNKLEIESLKKERDNINIKIKEFEEQKDTIGLKIIPLTNNLLYQSNSITEEKLKNKIKGYTLKILGEKIKQYLIDTKGFSKKELEKQIKESSDIFTSANGINSNFINYFSAYDKNTYNTDLELSNIANLLIHEENINNKNFIKNLFGFTNSELNVLSSYDDFDGNISSNLSFHFTEDEYNSPDTFYLNQQSQNFSITENKVINKLSNYFNKENFLKFINELETVKYDEYVKEGKTSKEIKDLLNDFIDYRKDLLQKKQTVPDILRDMLDIEGREVIINKLITKNILSKSEAEVFNSWFSNPIFDNISLNQQIQAAILLRNNYFDIIYGMFNPNVSSFTHEAAHRWERELTDEQRQQVIDFYNKDQERLTGKNPNTTKWTRETSEKFARGFEKYLYDGEAPSSSLKKLFDQFSEWLREIYKSLIASDIDIELNDQMKGIYAAMLGENYVSEVKQEVLQEQNNEQIIEEKTTTIEQIDDNSLLKEIEDLNSKLLKLYSEEDTEEIQKEIDNTINLIQDKQNELDNIESNKILDTEITSLPALETPSLEIIPIENYSTNETLDELVENNNLSLEEAKLILEEANLPTEELQFRADNPQVANIFETLFNGDIESEDAQRSLNYAVVSGSFEDFIKNYTTIPASEILEVLNKIVSRSDNVRDEINSLKNKLSKRLKEEEQFQKEKQRKEQEERETASLNETEKKVEAFKKGTFTPKLERIVSANNSNIIPFNKTSISKDRYDNIVRLASKFAKLFPVLKLNVIEDKGNKAKGYIANGEVFINLAYATTDTPIHEFLHLFVAALKTENPKLLNSLLREIQIENTDYVESRIEELDNHPFYKNLSEYDKLEEVLVQYLGEKIAELHDDDGNFIAPYVFALPESYTEDNRRTGTFSDSDKVKFWEQRGYVVDETYEGTSDLNPKVRMVHPNSRAITKSFFGKFYDWFVNLINKFLPHNLKTIAGNNLVFQAYDKADFNPKTNQLLLYTPAKNKGEYKQETLLDEEGNTLDIKELTEDQVLENSAKIKKAKANRTTERASYVLDLNKTEEGVESLKKRGASDEDIQILKDLISNNNGEDRSSINLISYSPQASTISASKELEGQGYMSDDFAPIIDISQLPVSMTLNDIASLMAYNEKAIYDLKVSQNVVQDLVAYQYSTTDAARDFASKVEKRIAQLSDLERRIGGSYNESAKAVVFSKSILTEVNTIKKILRDYDGVQFISEYVRNGVGALSDAAKIIKFIKNSLTDKANLTEQDIQQLNRDMSEATQLMKFYEDIEKVFGNNQDLFDESEGDYFKTVFSVSHNRFREIKEILLGLTTEWLYPVIEKSQKTLPKEKQITKDQFKNNLRSADQDISTISYYGQAAINSTDPLTQALAIKLKEDTLKNNVKSDETRFTLLDLYNKFLNKTGLSNNKTSVQEYYKKNYLRKAKSWELINIDKDGVKKYDYVERWAFHEEYLNDKWFDERRKYYDSLITKYGEPSNYAQKEILDERMNLWEQSNSKTLEKFRNPEFTKLKNDEYYMFLYNNYKEANAKYGERALSFGVVPQAYNKEGTLENLKSTYTYVKGVITSETSNANKAKTLFNDLGNTLLNTDSFAKLQALNLDGTYYMAVKSPFTHLIDNERVDLSLNESVLGFIDGGNTFRSLRDNQAAVENLKILINGNTKLGVDARKVLKSQYKSKDGVTAADKVWDKFTNTPQDKEQSAKRISKQLEALINDRFYGISETQLDFQIPGTEVVVNVNKVTNNLGFFTALMNMAGNVLAGVSNITIGNLMSLGESIGGKYYTPKDWGKAQVQYGKALLSGQFFADTVNPVKSKITQLGILFDAIQGEFRDKYGKNITGNILQKYMTKDTLFILSHMGEHQIQLTGMLALLNNTKVKLKDGVEISLYDAFIPNEKGFYGIRKDAIWSNQDNLDFTKKLHGISRELNGNYSAEDKSMLQRNAFGKSALQYRKYLYTAWRSRFAKERIDYERQTTSEGYYRAFFSNLLSDIKEYKFEALKRNLFDPFSKNKTISPEQAYAARKTLFELTGTFALLIIGTALANAEAPDDEDEKYWNQLLQLQLNKIYGDFSQYNLTIIKDTMKLYENPAASFKTLSNIGDFFNQIFKDVRSGEFETYSKKTGNNNVGDSKISGKFEKLIPLYRQYLKLLTPEEQLKYFNLLDKNFKKEK